MIVAEDGLGGNLAAIAEAKRAGIAVFVVPYEYSSKEQIHRHCVAHVRQPGALGFAVMATVLPKWVTYTAVHGPLARASLRSILSIELSGLRPRDVWTVHGGAGGKLLSESPRMTEHYADEMIPETKISEVGSLALDELATAMKRATPREDRHRILVSLPPDYFAERKPADFQSYEQMVEAWIGAARDLGEVVVQAHPAARDRLTSMGVEFDTRDIVELIAECDVLTTSVSSIIRLALAAGKPVVNYDCYRFRYDDYAGLRTCRTVYDFVTLKAGLSFAATHLDLGTVEEAARWGSLDGRAGERMLKALGVGSTADVPTLEPVLPQTGSPRRRVQTSAGRRAEHVEWYS